MIKNYYYLIVGILAILFSFSHAWNGQANFLPIVESSGFELSTETIIFYIWHILTAENLIFGVAFLIMSVSKNLSRVRFTAWMIAIIMVARWAVIFGSTLLKDKNGIADTLTDSIAILVFVGLILLGTRKKDKNEIRGRS